MRRCPKCNREKGVKPYGVCGNLFWCASCAMAFDDDPDEGGTHHDRDVSRRLEREEARPKKQWLKRV